MIKKAFFTSILVVLAFFVFFLFSFSGHALPESARFQKVRDEITPQLAEQLTEKGLELGQPIFIRIFKESRELELWILRRERYTHFKTYPICTYSGMLGPKQREGDLQAPEGFYFVTPARMNPNSTYHLSFNLGYPNAYDRAHNRTGDYLMVHGNCVSIGCYAMTDAGIEEIYLLAHAALEKGQKFFSVHAFPFRMTEENMQRHHASEWRDFWKNLQEGYEAFERTFIPPEVTVRDKRYVFSMR